MRIGRPASDEAASVSNTFRYVARADRCGCSREEPRHDLLLSISSEKKSGMSALCHVERHREAQARLRPMGTRRDDTMRSPAEKPSDRKSISRKPRGLPLTSYGRLRWLRWSKFSCSAACDVPELRVRDFVSQREDALLGAVERRAVCPSVPPTRRPRPPSPRRSRRRRIARSRTMARVPFDLHRGGHQLGELAQVRRPTDRVELLAARPPARSAR